MDSRANGSWWQWTFDERREALEAVFGPSRPPGSPEHYVLTFKWDDVDIPGGSCLVFPPQTDVAPPREPHDDWLYVSLGLTQPRRPRKGARVGPGYASEFAVLVRDAADWVAPVIRKLMWYVRARRPIVAGDRMPFGFERLPGGAVEATIGEIVTGNNAVVGEMRALLFWPILSNRSVFTTSTGPFQLLVATAITGAEWELAKALSTEHLLLLLHRAGIGQCSDPMRRSVTSVPELEDELRRVHQLTPDAAATELTLGRAAPNAPSS